MDHFSTILWKNWLNSDVYSKDSMLLFLYSEHQLTFFTIFFCLIKFSIQCSDTGGWPTGGASSLRKLGVGLVVVRWWLDCFGRLIPWHALTHHSSTWSCPSSFLYTAYINLSPMQCFHYFWRPAWHSSNVPGCKSYAVWNTRSILPPPPPTGFPAGHQVYDLRNVTNI